MNSLSYSRKRWITSCFVLLVLSVGGLFAGSIIALITKSSERSSIIAGPYTNSVSATSAKIIWISPGDDLRTSIVVRGFSSSKELSLPVSSSTIPNSKAFLYVAELKELSPYTKYHYVIFSGEHHIEGGSFRTLPESHTQEFTFALYGDHRSRPGNHRKVADAIADEKPLFVLSSGDMVSDGTEFSQWPREFFNPATQLLRNTPLWTTRGNHESKGPLYSTLFELPENELYYAFDCGPASFVILDSIISESQHKAQLKWLTRHFAKLRERETKPWIFVLLHYPIFNIGGHGTSWGHKDVLPVLQEAGVDFVLSGHSHLYERILPVSGKNGSVIQCIVSGGGGAPTYPAEPSLLLAHGIGVSVHHYCLFTVGPDEVTVTVRQVDGGIIDRFSVARPDPAMGISSNVVMDLPENASPVLQSPISYRTALFYQRLSRERDH